MPQRNHYHKFISKYQILQPDELRLVFVFMKVDIDKLVRSKPARDFYIESLKILQKSGVPFMLVGTFTMNAYCGIVRPTKDMDILCRPGDYPKLINIFKREGYKAVIHDERWIVKIKKGRAFFDIIFNSTTGFAPVTDDWFANAEEVEIAGLKVKILGSTECVWTKSFIQNRGRYDGNDIAHLILKKHENIDWKKLLGYMDQYWEVLLMHLLKFRFIYPSERGIIPKWLIEELTSRLKEQINLPPFEKKISRGRLFSPDDFEVDIKEWGFDPMSENVL